MISFWHCGLRDEKKICLKRDCLLDDNKHRGFWLDKSRWTSQKWDPNSVRVTKNLHKNTDDHHSTGSLLWSFQKADCLGL
jgi:hypothetical protein